jgi:hypothetical protein
MTRYDRLPVGGPRWRLDGECWSMGPDAGRHFNFVGQPLPTASSHGLSLVELQVSDRLKKIPEQISKCG